MVFTIKKSQTIIFTFVHPFIFYKIFSHAFSFNSHPYLMPPLLHKTNENNDCLRLQEPWEVDRAGPLLLFFQTRKLRLQGIVSCPMSLRAKLTVESMTCGSQHLSTSGWDPDILSAQQTMVYPIAPHPADTSLQTESINTGATDSPIMTAKWNFWVDSSREAGLICSSWAVIHVNVCHHDCHTISLWWQGLGFRILHN